MWEARDCLWVQVIINTFISAFNSHSTSETTLFIPCILEDFSNDYYSHIFCTLHESPETDPCNIVLMSFFNLMDIARVSLTRQLFRIIVNSTWTALFTFCNTGPSVLCWPHSVSRWCFKSATFAFTILKKIIIMPCITEPVSKTSFTVQATVSSAT